MVQIIDLRIKFNQGDVSYNELTVLIILNLGTRVVGVVVGSVSDVLTPTPDRSKLHPLSQPLSTRVTSWAWGLPINAC